MDLPTTPIWSFRTVREGLPPLIVKPRLLRDEKKRRTMSHIKLDALTLGNEIWGDRSWRGADELLVRLWSFLSSQGRYIWIMRALWETRWNVIVVSSRLLSLTCVFGDAYSSDHRSHCRCRSCRRSMSLIICAPCISMKDDCYNWDIEVQIEEEEMTRKWHIRTRIQAETRFPHPTRNSCRNRRDSGEAELHTMRRFQ